MNKLAFIAAALCAGIGAAALAQGGPPPDPFGDATVSKAEFDKNAAQRFDQLDANHDGSLSSDERPFGGRFGGNKGAAMSKSDFMTRQDRRFTMMDSNHDGMLSKAERDAFRKKMMERFRNRSGGGQ